jgi:hypothetical protein
LASFSSDRFAGQDRRQFAIEFDETLTVLYPPGEGYSQREFLEPSSWPRR